MYRFASSETNGQEDPTRDSTVFLITFILTFNLTESVSCLAVIFLGVSCGKQSE